jgi:hypothetical protein
MLHPTKDFISVPVELELGSSSFPEEESEEKALVSHAKAEQRKMEGLGINSKMATKMFLNFLSTAVLVYLIWRFFYA